MKQLKVRKKRTTMIKYTDQKLEEVKKATQGAVANYNGQKLEDRVENILSNAGVLSMLYKDWMTTGTCPKVQALLLKRVPYTKYDGAKGYGEFVLSRDGKADIRIECRFQKVPGTADEKTPALYMNALSCEEKDIILVVDGPGFRKTTIDWLRASCEAIKYKNIKMLSLKEFSDWVLENV